MSRVYVTKRFTFEAAHFLSKYKGLCANVHGHSYKLEVTVSGQINKDSNSQSYGMVIDFKELKDIVQNHVIRAVDHKHLNSYFDYPTAEFLAVAFYDVIASSLPEGVKLECVRLWETEDSYAEYKGEE